MILIAPFLALLFFVLPMTAALGETMIEMTLEEKVRASDLVVHGRIVEVQSRRGGTNNSTVWTDYIVDVLELLHGSEEGKRVIVTQQGGVIDNVILEVGSNPELIEGDEVVLFLARADFLSEADRGGGGQIKYTIVGVAQGTYYILGRGGENIAAQNYARLAIVPREELEPPESRTSFGEKFKGELERLREEVKHNPNNRNLARRLAQAERLLEADVQLPGRKPAGNETRKKTYLGAKPPPPEPVEEDTEAEKDISPGLHQRAEESAKALQEQYQRFEALAQPMPLQDLKDQIREISRRIADPR